jgi:hypothetical protein
VRGETFIPPNSIVPTTPAPAPPVAQTPVSTHLEVNKPAKPGLSATLSAFSDSGPEPVSKK